MGTLVSSLKATWPNQKSPIHDLEAARDEVGEGAVERDIDQNIPLSLGSMWVYVEILQEQYNIHDLIRIFPRTSNVARCDVLC